jgi:flagellar biosynthesis/type III secretory pathway protein FliH
LKIDGPINNLITNFWEEVVVKSLEKNSKFKVSLQLRVQFENLEIRSLSYLDTVVLSDFN